MAMEGMDDGGADYRALMAKVDDAIVETRGHSDRPPLPLWVKKEHSLFALFPTESDEKLDRRHAYVRFAFSLVTPLFISLMCSDMAFGVGWLVESLLWAPAVFCLDVLLRNPRCKPYDWPWGFGGALGVLAFASIIWLALITPVESVRTFSIFALSFFTNMLIEVAVLYARYYHCWNFGTVDTSEGAEYSVGAVGLEGGVL